MRIRFFPLIICVFFLSGNIFAQSTDEGIGRASYGIFGDFSLNFHSANFKGLPGVPSCCPRYENGTGTGPALGGIYQMPLSNLFNLQLRAAYHSISGTLTATEATTVLHNGVPEVGTFTHTLSTGLSTIGIEPMIGMRVLGDLQINVGFSAGILLAKTFAEREEITSPDGGGTFIDSTGSDSHSRIRNDLTGTIPNTTSLQVAAIGGVSYPLPLNAERTVMLVPEILYSFGITKIASALTWNVNSLRFGVALMFSPKPLPEHEREEHIDTIRIDKKGINATKYLRGKESITINESDHDGRKLLTQSVTRTDTLFVPKFQTLQASITANVPAAKLVIEEFSSTIMTPLLNYVFFEENSSDIPQRYTRLYNYNIDTFTIADIHSSQKLSTYHHLLNIIARRLLDNPSGIITLTGCNQDIREEKNNLQLSRERAESVKNYLTDTWKISSDRIKIEARNLSLKAANSETADGAQENRRVEITSNDPKILFPVITNDTLRTANPPTVQFSPTANTEVGLQNWKVTAMQDGKLLKRFTGVENMPSSVTWDIDASSMPHIGGEIKYMLVVKDSLGMLVTNEHSLPFEQITIRKKREERRGDTVINRFSLILFDIGSSTITPSNVSIIPLIKDYIKPLSQVTVTGYTDRLGEASYNQQLSEKRAATLAAALGSKNITAKGLGPTDLFDSSLPEGRLYTRTVDVEIHTPIGN